MDLRLLYNGEGELSTGKGVVEGRRRAGVGIGPYGDTVSRDVKFTERT